MLLFFLVVSTLLAMDFIIFSVLPDHNFIQRMYVSVRVPAKVLSNVCGFLGESDPVFFGCLSTPKGSVSVGRISTARRHTNDQRFGKSAMSARNGN